MKHADLPFIKWISYKRKIWQDKKIQRAVFLARIWFSRVVNLDPSIWCALDYKVFKRFFILAILSHRNRDRREILIKLIMSYGSLVRIVEYSHKMIEKIAKEVEDNFTARKELFYFFKISSGKIRKVD